MPVPPLRSAALAALLTVLAAPFAAAQGGTSYYNVESPQVKAIAVATLNGHDYVLACNTPDSSVEIFDTVGNAHVATVRTGAEPISVTWDPATSRLYTANFLGDSVTSVELVPGTGSNPPRALLRRTEWVGDEPAHVAILPGGLLGVTLSSSSALAILDAATLRPFIGSLDLLDSFAAPTRALKEPRVIAAIGTLIVVLGHRGGKAAAGLGEPYDMDLWWLNLATGGVGSLGNLGTTNFSMAFAQNGDLFVVATDAQLALVGETAVRSAPTGFAQTMLYQVSGIGGPNPRILARDLGRTTVPSGQLGNPVAAVESLAHATDVAVYEPAGGPRKLYLAAFNSDRVGVLEPSGALPNAWPIRARIAIQPVSAGVPNAMAGPRALAVKHARPAVPGDPGARIYALNRLDNSISAIDPTTDNLVATFALPRDPTPLHIKGGRKFLYDARLSGNGFSACASCHTDGRSDWLAWDLSDGVTVLFSAALNGGIATPPPALTWPGGKGRLVTQSLQGMLNAEVNPEAQPFFTNEPLHWRADRRTLANFNPAFQVLLGGAQLSPVQMAAFRAFAMSIHYPPNPEQDLTRRPRGIFGTPNLTDGSGAARGLKLFCIRPLTVASPGGSLAAGRSCIQCHEPPEGSDNMVTIFDRSTSTPGVLQPLESTSLRLLRAKERRLERSAAGSSSIATGMFGTSHEGSTHSTNDFIRTAFGQDLRGASEVEDVIQLNREWDTGTGPLVGRPLTADLQSRAALAGALALFEAQAQQANAGIAITGRIAGTRRGFWYDLSGAVPVYREEPSGATFTRAALLALIATADDVLVFEATPLGSERRSAWPLTGSPPPLPGPQPSNLTLEPMPPGPFWQDLPRITANWDISGAGAFSWQSTQPPPVQLRRKRIAQKGLVVDGAGLGLGIAQPRHEAPRRIAVAGDDIRHGANVIVLIPLNPTSPPPTIAAPFTWMWLPIHPTGRVTAAGKRIWETHAELDPFTAYMLMLGSLAAPNVAALTQGTFTQEPPPQGTFDPANWNRYWVLVLNADGTLGLTFGERFRMQ